MRILYSIIRHLKSFNISNQVSNSPILMNNLPYSLLMLSLLFLQIINSGDCEIISYANEIIHPLQPVYLSIPKFSPADAPHTSPGTGVSYVDMTGVGVNLDCDGNDCHATTLEVLIFKAPDTMWWMDYWEDREICCTKQLASESIKGCTQSNVNKMIIPSDAEVKYSSTLNTIELTAQEKSFHFGDSQHLKVH